MLQPISLKHSLKKYDIKCVSKIPHSVFRVKARRRKNLVSSGFGRLGLFVGPNSGGWLL